MAVSPPPPAGCPVCGQSNGTRSVSAIVEGAQPRRSVPGGPAGAAPQFANLARRLAPPRRPSMLVSGRVGCLITMVSFSVATLLATLGGWLASLTLGDYYRQVAALDPEQTGAYAGVALFMLVFVVCFFGGFVIYQRTQTGRLRAEGEVWRKAMTRWEQLHYCGHCDVVFFPGQARHAPAAQLRTLLVDPQPAPEPQPAPS